MELGKMIGGFGVNRVGIWGYNGGLWAQGGEMRGIIQMGSRGHSSFKAVLSVALILFGVWSCSEGKSQVPKPKPAVPVTVAAVMKKTIPLDITAIGTVQEYTTVAIKSRVGGELLRVHFREGQEVSKGDLLFTIDPRPYEAALAEAKAKLAKDMALLRKAQEDARRYASLIEKQVVSQEQYDQVRANLASLEATVKADEAAVESAKLQLSYCYIYSPVSGRTGSLLAHPGNIVKANDENKSLVVIRQLEPIYVAFSVPEGHLPLIRSKWSKGRLPVLVNISDGTGRQLEGELTFMENTVDVTTGTILLKATFPNKDRSLWPGQFVNVRLRLEEEPDALVVPSQAIQTGQQGAYVFVVKGDSTVEIRPVKVARTMGEEVVVSQGLQAGEQVVTEGQIRLVPGAKVEVKNNPSQEGSSP